MATFNSVASGTLNMIDETLLNNSLSNLAATARGLMIDLFSIDISQFTDFNALNHKYMDFHMMRNIYEKEITLNSIGANAYANGNPDNLSIARQKPSYTDGVDYVEFVNSVHRNEKDGVLTTRIDLDPLQTSNVFNKVNLYLDSEDGFGDATQSGMVSYTGDATDRNSILYKTQKLIRENKLKTIVSDFHTNGVEYPGQVRSAYGESHGRNLLTKDAENGGSGYSINGYDNPYCRVWTHHYQYDRFAKTMRAGSGGMNTWEGFEWSDEDRGHTEDKTNYGDGENYDYAWRGHHNQKRRAEHSVLDTSTGLVKIAPIFGGGENKNRHTKDCMFSIENLAWKDYDPYSFEQALSWEQRGPMGGRIMWFPPYGIEIQESTSAKWNTNEFIGRGENIYTYVNTERTGSLSFIMLTDHPSSVDYASWWGDSLSKGGPNSNSETDYLRYFAGCFGNTPDGQGNLANDDKDNLEKHPQFYTDEEDPPIIKPEAVKVPEAIPPKTPPQEVPPEIKNSEKIGFVVFYPNNYSGIQDAPTKPNALVNSIAYLLAGVNAQKTDGVVGEDWALSDGSDKITSKYPDMYIGYEMKEGSGISTDTCITDNQFIQGGYIGKTTYVPQPKKQWQYRVDHKQKDAIDGGTLYIYKGEDAENTLNQVLKGGTKDLFIPNYKDSKSNQYNLKAPDLSSSDAFSAIMQDGVTLYSFAEVAAAMYSEGLYNKPVLYQYLLDSGVDQEKVNKLIEIFTDKNREFIKGIVGGMASSQGKEVETGTNRNRKLAENRALNIKNWLSQKWSNIEVDGNPRIGEVNNSHDVNDPQAKLYRSAYCVLEFGGYEVKSVTQTEPEPEIVEGSDGPLYEAKGYVGFKFIRSELKGDGVIWNYYQKDGTKNYYEQVSGDGVDNYDDPGENAITVAEENVLNIFSDNGDTPTVDEQGNIFSSNIYRPWKHLTIESDEKYRGDYDETGTYVDLKDSNEPIFYVIGDFVKYNNKYYKCKVNFVEKYADFTFNEQYWDDINTFDADKMSDCVKSPYAAYEDEPADGYDTYSVVFLDDKWQVCTKVNTISDIVELDVNVWDDLVGHDGYVTLDEALEHPENLDDRTHIVYEGERYQYVGPDGAPHNPDDFDDRDWEKIDTDLYSLDEDYQPGAIVRFRGEVYYATGSENHLYTKYKWSDDMAIFLNITETENPDGEFDGNYPYIVGDICKHDNRYWRANTDSDEWEKELIEFDIADWDSATDSEMYTYFYKWEIANIVDKVAAVLCWTVDKVIEKISGSAKHNDFEYNSQYDCIWKYGTTNNFVSPETVTTSTNLTAYVDDCERNSQDTENTSAKIRFTSDEQNYLKLMTDEGIITSGDLSQLRKYIIMYRLLDTVTNVENSQGTRNVCATAAETTDEMEAKSERQDESETEGCDNIWIDRGDGLLIQECNIPHLDENGNLVPGDFKRTLNKLRYDQEYYFYKKYMADHPFVFDKLQEKLKYFNPAFHSMTPEGFNARLTFLEQCTRQGNTKTISDIGGMTANNLAFGRPPYCVLRLGDFYNQMIVIDNISKDYSISDGLQWDLNAEGNGVQPMLCKVSINFKFIGGGDITGPVQRLQNAMSFNYYANTSFYDNRADRPEYQDTNWRTMGGAGNNQLDYDKSYAYIAQRYDANKESWRFKGSDD